MSTSKLTQNRNRRGGIAAKLSIKLSIVSGSLWLRFVSGMAVAAIAPVGLISTPVQAAVVEDWKLNPNTGQVEVLLPEGVTPQLSVLSQPGRFVLDLPQTEVGVNVTEFYENSLVRQVSLTQVDNQTARLTVDFSPGVVLDAKDVELQQIGIDNLWIVRPRVQSFPEPQIAPEPSLTPSEDAAGESVTEAVESPTEQAAEPPPPPSTTVVESQLESYPSADVLQIPLEEPQNGELLPEGTTAATPSDPSEVTEEMVVEEEVTEYATSRVIPYGEPIPKASEGEVISFRPQTIDQSPPNLLLAAGDSLTLRYPSPVEVPLSARPDRQEVLLLQGGIVDREGRYIIPPDTPVIGRFETSSKGSRFVAVAINLEDRTIPIEANSEWIEGKREIDTEKVAIDSGIGGLGGLLISGFSGIGLLVGAIGGAAVAIASSPEPTTLLPGQLIEVQLLDDLPKSELVYYGIDQVPPFNHTQYFD